MHTLLQNAIGFTILYSGFVCTIPKLYIYKNSAICLSDCRVTFFFSFFFFFFCKLQELRNPTNNTQVDGWLSRVVAVDVYSMAVGVLYYISEVILENSVGNIVYNSFENIFPPRAKYIFPLIRYPTGDECK